MEKTYNPQDIEQPLYEHWEKQGYFKPNGDESQESFCIMIPPLLPTRFWAWPICFVPMNVPAKLTSGLVSIKMRRAKPRY